MNIPAVVVPFRVAPVAVRIPTLIPLVVVFPYPRVWSSVCVPPPPPVALIVTCPVEPEIVTPVPATIEVTIPVRFVPEPVEER